MYKFEASPNFTEMTRRKIDAIVFHFTGSASLDGTVSWFKNPNSKVSAHYVIGQDGRIVQMVKEKDRAWHAGTSRLDGKRNVNNFSIGIEVVNWGLLKEKDGLFYCWPDYYTRKYEVEKYGCPVNINGKWWAPYHKNQINSCIVLAKDLRVRYPKITEDRIVGHQDVSPGRKNDPGPAFPMDEIISESSPTLPKEWYI